MAEECANPLLLTWLKEWMDEAQERNSKGFLVYKKAYQSMKACPLTFHHPTEAQQLNGLGPKLCDRLTDKLKAHCAQHGLPMPEKAAPKAKRSNAEHEGNEENNEADRQSKKKTRKAAPYVPKLRSGAYALVMALSELDEEGTQALSKTDLIERAQPYSDSSFTTPSDPTKFYTAWKSMQTLETKELVCTRGHPTKRYYLSDEGWEVAKRMRLVEGCAGGHGSKQTTRKQQSQASTRSALSSHDNIRDRLPREGRTVELSLSPEPDVSRFANLSRDSNIGIRDESGTNGMSTNTRDAKNFVPIVLRPGTFEVKLVIDTREIRTTSDRDYMSTELKKLGIISETRALPLGDVLWIAKVKSPHDVGFKAQNIGDDEEGSTEIVLEHVAERKRLDDLISSIKDGRFHEQKFRLRKSGMRHVTYLIEDYSISTEHGEKYGEAVDSAIAGMQVVNDIFVKQTSKIDETIRYLARMTTMLKEMYEQKELHVIPSRSLDMATYLATLSKHRESSPDKTFCITFSAFCSICDKSDSMTLRDIYLKMLMCTRGVTGDKAIEIQKVWQTPRALIEAYEKSMAEGKSKDVLISDQLGSNIPRKKVAKTLSAKIAEVWAG